MAADFIDTLQRLGIAEYADSFINEGFDTWETLIEITESDLQDLNVKLGHRRKLQKAIAEFKEESRATSHPRHPRPLSLGAGQTTDHADSDSVRPVSEGGGGTSAKRTKRKYRRHPKNDANAPVKPVSAYVLFSNDMRDSLKNQELSFTDMAKIVGERWQVLPADKREQYERTAQNAKDRYQAEMAQYKKTPEYSQYQTYLAKWKAKHAAGQDGKRPKVANDTGSDDGNASADENSRYNYRGHRGSISSNVSSTTALVRDTSHGHSSTHYSPPALPRDPYNGSTSSLATTPSLSHTSSASSQGHGSSNPSLALGNPPYSMTARRSPQNGHMPLGIPSLSRDGTSHSSHGSTGVAVSSGSRSEDSHSPTASSGLPNSPFSSMSLADRTQRLLPPPTATGNPNILPPLDRRDGKGNTLPSLRDITARAPLHDPLAALIKAGEMMESQGGC